MGKSHMKPAPRKSDVKPAPSIGMKKIPVVVKSDVKPAPRKNDVEPEPSFGMKKIPVVMGRKDGKYGWFQTTEHNPMWLGRYLTVAMFTTPRTPIGAQPNLTTLQRSSRRS